MKFRAIFIASLVAPTVFFTQSFSQRFLCFPSKDLWETAIYASLKCHNVNDDSLWVVAPWGYMMQKACKGQSNIFKDFFEARVFDRATIICGGCDHYERTLPALKKMGITRIFTPSCSPERNHHGIEVVPMLFQPANSTSCGKKNILYSFVGDAKKSKPVRVSIANLKTPRDAIIITRGDFLRAFWGTMTDKEKKERFRREYVDIMSRSRFALCPSGITPITFRLTEAMVAGAIPVLFGPVQLPVGIDWNNIVLRLPEKDIPRIDSIIRSIPADREARMRKACLELAAKMAEDPAYFIRLYFDCRVGNKA